MHLGHVTCAVLLGLAVYVQADSSAEVHVVSGGNCGPDVLKRKGVDISTYRPKISFDPKRVETIPKKPVVPGCFRLIARNATLNVPVTQLTSEVEMRISSNADPSKPVLQCKKKSPKCGCGERDACTYCDFCKNVKKFIGDATVNNKELNVDSVKPTCDCDVPPGTYTIDVEVCTPDEKELGQNLPTEVLNYVADDKSFSLFTTIYIYNFRFNSLSNSDSSPAAKKSLADEKG